MTPTFKKCLSAALCLALLVAQASIAAAQSCPTGQANPTIRCGARPGPFFEVIADIAHAQGCKSRCDDLLRCRAWTYTITTSSCGLRAQDAPVQNDDCCFTGKKF